MAHANGIPNTQLVKNNKIIYTSNKILYSLCHKRIREVNGKVGIT